MAPSVFGHDGSASDDLRPQRPGRGDGGARRARGDRQPGEPERGLEVSRPSDALEARAAAATAFTALFLGLGAVALLVGGVGIANVMLMSVLERRGEIGLRRALGATRRHIALQFVAESLAFALLGGLLGVGVGIAVSVAYATIQGWIVGDPARGPGRGARRRRSSLARSPASTRRCGRLASARRRHCGVRERVVPAGTAASGSRRPAPRGAAARRAGQPRRGRTGSRGSPPCRASGRRGAAGAGPPPRPCGPR